MKKTYTLSGEKLAKTVINRILASPECWDQTAWHSACGTKHCFAGHCQIASGQPKDDSTAKGDAMDALGITKDEADYLFRGSASLSELYYFAEHFGDAGWDRDGFNRAGFNRDGFNRDGFNRAGFNRDGFNRDGFNRAGFNRDGFNRDGFNRDGFNRDGFNRDGFNRAGFNRDGKKLKPFDL